MNLPGVGGALDGGLVQVAHLREAGHAHGRIAVVARLNVQPADAPQRAHVGGVVLLEGLAKGACEV